MKRAFTRRDFLGLAALAAPAALPGSKPPGRLNFVFILTDDLGWADTGVYGADLHTPTEEEPKPYGRIYSGWWCEGDFGTRTLAARSFTTRQGLLAGMS